MRLTKHTDYAFRVLIYLATLPDDRLVTVQEIAQAFDISRSHIMKIVQKLAAAKLVHASRGHNGGLKLGQSPADVNVRTVIELMEATLAPVSCDAPVCMILKTCTLKTILFDAQRRFLDHVGQFTLADLVDPHASVAPLLHPAGQLPPKARSAR